MVRACDGSELPKGDKSKVYLLRTFGNAAHEIWDVSDPARPALLTTIIKGLKGLTRTGGSAIAHRLPGLRDRRLARTAHDAGVRPIRPAKPVFIRNFGLPGQQPGATGPAPADLPPAPSPPAPRATASISATARTRTESCRSSTGRS